MAKDEVAPKQYTYQIDNDSFSMRTLDPHSVKSATFEFIDSSDMVITFDEGKRIFTISTGLGNNVYEIFIPPDIYDMAGYIQAKMNGTHVYKNELKFIKIEFGADQREIELPVDLSGNSEYALLKATGDGVIDEDELFISPEPDGTLLSIFIEGETNTRYFIPPGEFTVSQLITFIKDPKVFSPDDDVDIIIDMFATHEKIDGSTESFSPITYTTIKNTTETVETIINNALVAETNDDLTIDFNKFVFTNTVVATVNFNAHKVWVKEGTYTVPELATYLQGSKNISVKNASFIKQFGMRVISTTESEVILWSFADAPLGQELTLTGIFDFLVTTEPIPAIDFEINEGDFLEFLVKNEDGTVAVHKFNIPFSGTINTGDPGASLTLNDLKNLVTINYPLQSLINQNENIIVKVVLDQMPEYEVIIEPGETLSLREVLQRLTTNNSVPAGVTFELFSTFAETTGAVTFTVIADEITVHTVDIIVAGTEPDGRIFQGQYSIEELSSLPDVPVFDEEINNPEFVVSVVNKLFPGTVVHSFTPTVSDTEITLAEAVNQLPAEGFSSTWSGVDIYHHDITQTINESVQSFKMYVDFGIFSAKLNLVNEVSKNRNVSYVKPDSVRVVLDTNVFNISYPTTENFTIVDVLSIFKDEIGDIDYIASKDRDRIFIDLGNETYFFYFDITGDTLTINDIIELVSTPDKLAVFGGNDQIVIKSDLEEDVFNIQIDAPTSIEEILNSIDKEDWERDDVISISKSDDVYRFFVDNINDGERIPTILLPRLFNDARSANIFEGGSSLYQVKIGSANYNESGSNGAIPAGSYTWRNLFDFVNAQVVIGPVEATFDIAETDKVKIEVGNDNFEFSLAPKTYTKTELQTGLGLGGILHTENFSWGYDITDKFLLEINDATFSLDVDRGFNQITNIITKLGVTFIYLLKVGEKIIIDVDYFYFVDKIFDEVNKQFVHTYEQRTDNFILTMQEPQRDTLPDFLNFGASNPLIETGTSAGSPVSIKTKVVDGEATPGPLSSEGADSTTSIAGANAGETGATLKIDGDSTQLGVLGAGTSGSAPASDGTSFEPAFVNKDGIITISNTIPKTGSKSFIPSEGEPFTGDAVQFDNDGNVPEGFTPPNFDTFFTMQVEASSPLLDFPDGKTVRVLLDEPKGDEIDNPLFFLPANLKERLEIIATYINSKTGLESAAAETIGGKSSLTFKSMTFGSQSVVKLQPKSPFLQITN